MTGDQLVPAPYLTGLIFPLNLPLHNISDNVTVINRECLYLWIEQCNMSNVSVKSSRTPPHWYICIHAGTLLLIYTHLIWEVYCNGTARKQITIHGQYIGWLSAAAGGLYTWMNVCFKSTKLRMASFMHNTWIFGRDPATTGHVCRQTHTHTLTPMTE